MSHLTGHNKSKRNKWAIDLNPRKGEHRQEFSSPPGFSGDRQTHNDKVHGKEDTNRTSLVDKRSWDVALGPIKSLPMNIFLMYMSGNTISIFPIMMLGMMFFRPVQAMMAIRTTMKMLERSKQYCLLTFVFALGNLLAIGLAVYKCHSMGLLPTHESDWLSFVSPLERWEYVGGGMTMQ